MRGDRLKEIIDAAQASQLEGLDLLKQASYREGRASYREGLDLLKQASYREGLDLL